MICHFVLLRNIMIRSSLSLAFLLSGNEFHLCEPNIPSTADLLLSLSLSHLPLCCGEMHSAVLKSVSGNPLWQSLRCLKKWMRGLPGAERGDRPCLPGTAGMAIFGVLFIYTFFSAQKRDEVCQARCSLAYHTISAQEQGRFLFSPFPSTMTAAWEHGEHWGRLEEEEGSVRRCENQSNHVWRVWLATPSILCLELG